MMVVDFLQTCGTLTLILLLSSAATLEPYDLLYDSGVEAFQRGDYANAVRDIEKALDNVALLRQTKIRCGLECRDQHKLDTKATETELRLFDVVLRRAACLNHCAERNLGSPSMHKVSADVNQDFHRRIPYNYLQLAYLKLKQPEKATAAAHTYFQANPEHIEINLEKFKALHSVEEKHFIDREARPHQSAFTAAVQLYDNGDFEESVTLFEEALAEYYKADAECRVLCEGPQSFRDHDHVLYRYTLSELISDHYTQVLNCKHECVRDLATRPGRLSPMENYLPLHYDYLQFAYFQVNDLEQALVCALSYLLFHKGEEFMTKNVEYYTEMLGHGGQPRQEAVNYLQRHKIELELLLIGSENLGVSYTEENYWSSSGGRDDGNRIPSGTDGWLEFVPISKKNNSSEVMKKQLQEGGSLLYDNIRLVQNSLDLNGTQRVVFDDVISENECSELTHLAHVTSSVGDGYRGKVSPHTPNEKFEGTTVLKTLQYGYEGRVPLRSARLFYDVSEKARKIIESYFMLNSTLHFSYTHLVCRTAVPDQQEHRNDLSHPIHADNCLLDPEARECWKEPPAYTYRDYSALLYLNGDFEGGQFIFTKMDAKTITASVKPRCGRMVGFSSGGENPHGVRAVTRGQRCAVAIWFTLDPLYRELERLQADEVIQALENQHQWDHDHINQKDEL
ncbi:prolyl 3-hydroxylase 2 [Tachysurus fulvidraco]|uniref:prolyl 3-hydroxylase 2 n=1 Tax=Tachysurus fulvidraco TaxID=1234273 RepID=UPI001FEFE3A9|nr:prolyl 3-hydroxylase 2 [Tachysurus fulvidraco]XP_047666256.1 prolyl 3-hydroxylase 2 [Tachysurus fulvidraco]